ncbi:right-handed parallel beta-helix repeat-containing protein [Hyalangium minutum]|uniref:Putative lipoprotein n=1 Tax=Hyalangium minutum TaxID=394096 RepID=A0A085WSR6_9BACT|nr:right-handed parallel beta-helix repeat-containing protein [Hyalangium minutum]KFE70729.1 putative lipoprotein [Hyalangium minutum]
MSPETEPVFTTIADSDVAATLPDSAWATSPGTRRIIYVSKQCGIRPCTDSETCGTSWATACRTLHKGLHKLMAEPGNPNLPGADELWVSGAAEPYYANHSFYWDQYGSGTAEHPKVIRGIRSESGRLPRIVVSPDDVPYVSLSGYTSGRDPVTQQAQPAAFTFSGSEYWILEGLIIDCNNIPVSNTRYVGVYAVGNPSVRANHLVFKQLDITRCANSAVQISSSDDIVVEGGYFRSNQRKEFDSQSGKWLRADSNGVSIYGSTRRVLIRGNTAYGNTGDGVQCQGRLTQTATNDDDPQHITIEGNLFYGNDENAVDIKTCHHVSVKGANHFLEYLPADTNGDDPNNTTQCGGAAVIVHEGATHILVEDALIENAGDGITIGNERWEVTDVIIRRNHIRNINQNSAIMESTGTIFYNCGDGIGVNRGDRIEVYHNTLQNIERSGIRVGVNSGYVGAKNVRVWNNIIFNAKGNAYYLKNSNPPRRSAEVGGALEYRMDNAPGLYSQANLLYRTGAPVSLIKVWLNSDGSRSWQPMSLSQWQAQTPTSAEAQGNLDNPATSSLPGTQEADPLFPEEGAYTLPGSPARDTALMGSGNEGPHQRCNGAPDKGAFESDCGADKSERRERASHP